MCLLSTISENSIVCRAKAQVVVRSASACIIRECSGTCYVFLDITYVQMGDTPHSMIVIEKIIIP
jgi:hypothetical protein